MKNDGGSASKRSLRDDFAKEALNGFCSDWNLQTQLLKSWGKNPPKGPKPVAKAFAQVSYLIADAMLAERSK